MMGWRRRGTVLRRALVAGLIATAVGFVAPTASRADTAVTFTVDATSNAGTLNRRVAGVVMEFIVSDSTPASLATDIGLRTGRYGIYPNNYANSNMSHCQNGVPPDWSIVDAELARAGQFGMDMSSLEVQLNYISPCATQPAPAGAALSYAQYPSIEATAIETNPQAVRSTMHDYIRHLAGDGVRLFAV